MLSNNNQQGASPAQNDKNMKEKFLVWRVCGSYGFYTVNLVRPDVNGNYRTVKHTDEWFQFSQIKNAEKLAATLNKRDGLKELY